MIMTSSAIGEILTIKDFVSEPDIFDLDVSPNGKYLAEVWREGSKRIVSIRDLSLPDYPVIGEFGDEITRPYAVKWASDDRLLVNMLVPYRAKKLRKKSQKEEGFDIRDFPMFTRTVSIRRDAKDAVLLMSDSSRLKRTRNLSSIRHTLPNDKDNVLMSAWVKGIFTLFKVNVYNGHSEQITRGSAHTIFFISDRNGEPLYRADLSLLRKYIYIYEYEGSNQWSKIYTIRSEKSSDDYDLEKSWLGVDKDRNLLYRKRNNINGFYEIIKRDRKSKENTVLVSEQNKDIVGLIYSDQDNEAIGYRVDGDVIQSRYFDAKHQEAHEKLNIKLDNNPYHVVSVDDDSKTLVIVTYGPDTTGSYFIYNLEKNSLQLYGAANNTLSPSNLGIAANAYFKTRDNTKIRMYLIFPPNYKDGEKYPLVMMPHGGPHIRDYSYYSSFAQFIATRGYIVARPNFRGSTGYGLEFEEAGYKEWGGLMQYDLDDATQFLIDRGYVDKEQICIVGGSYGGYAALTGVYQRPDLYKCAISINGVTDLKAQVKFFEKKFSSNKKLVKEVHERIGHPKNDAKMLMLKSPITQVSKIKAPVLLVAAENDNVVPFKQSKKMMKALTKHKSNVEFLPIKNSGHNIFYYKEDIEKVYAVVERFLGNNLNSSLPKK